MKRIFSTILQYTIFLGLGLFLLWWTTKNLTPAEIQHLKDSLNGAKYLLVIPAMILLLLAHYSRALRWKILMEPLGFQPTTINTFFAVMLGYFFNLLVPRLGEVMKCTMLARYEKTPVDKIIGTMVAERAIDVICLLIVIGVTVLLQVDIASSFLSMEWQKLSENRSGVKSLFRPVNVDRFDCHCDHTDHLGIEKICAYFFHWKNQSTHSGCLAGSYQCAFCEEKGRVYFSYHFHLVNVFVKYPAWFLCYGIC